MSDAAESQSKDQATTLSPPTTAPTSTPQQCRAATSTSLAAATSPTASMSSPPGVPRSSHTRFPVRVGISWVKGEKLEAMDFSRTWYPSKIVEIDEEKKLVLIHFEGWNQRYDEWVPMDSEKLRPSTRHSERKDKGPKKRRIHPHPIYRAGEQVLAKWTDCKKYPAKINRMMEDGSYEVNFYDGVSCQIQAMNIQPLPEEMKNLKSLQMKSPPSLKPKISFKNIKVSLPDSVKKRVEQHAAEKKRLELQSAVAAAAAAYKKKVDQQTSHVLKKRADAPAEVVKKKVEHGPPEVVKKKVEHRPLEVLKKKVEHGPLEVVEKKVEHGPPEVVKKKVEHGPLEVVKKKVEQTTQPDSMKKSLDQQTSELVAEVCKETVKRKLSPPRVYIKRELDKDSKDSFSCHFGHSPLKIKKFKEGTSNFIPESTKSSTETVELKCEKVTSTEIVSVKSELNEKVSLNARPVVEHEDHELKVSNELPTVQSGETNVQPVFMNIASTSPNEKAMKRTRCRRRKRRHFSQIKLHSKKLGVKPTHVVKTVPSIKSPVYKAARTKPVDISMEGVTTSHLTSVTDVPFPPVHKFIPSKAFIVEEDHNPFKCHHDGCSKAFRKESLLTSHIKYYHTDIEASSTQVSSPLGHALVQSPVSASGSRKRRKKTSSICSTDSDISIGSRERLLFSKRHRHDSEISVTTASPDLLGKDIWADLKHQHAAQENTQNETVGRETEADDFESDVVNCVCGQRETNGLMIQCDICMCWQHFACMDTNNTGEPPANYVCFICENTPGIRDSCKYMYDLSWEKKGDLPAFPFVSDAPTEGLKTLAVECHEISSTLHKIRSALHSTRRQIKISKEEDDHEFQLWQTDWDNWTKPDEDLTLTPRSVDPDPSPTPSTFLFPSAPSASLSNVCSTATLASTSPVTAPPAASATIEVASGLPSPLNSSKLNHGGKTIETFPVDSSPPGYSMLPLTGGETLLSSGEADKLAHNFFPGPGGDADKCQSLRPTTDSVQSMNAVERAEEENASVKAPLKLNGDNVPTECNQGPSKTKDTLQPSGTKNPPGAANRESLPAVESKDKTSVANTGDDVKSFQAIVLADPFSNAKASANLSKLELLADTSADQPHISGLNGPKILDKDELIDGQATKQLSELFVDVNGVQSHSTVYTDDQDNDTDTAEESVDPYKNCEHNLLVHVTNVHDSIEKHLELIEQQIIELENAEHNNSTVQLTEENILNDVPALKKSLGKLARNLYKVQRLCLHN